RSLSAARLGADGVRIDLPAPVGVAQARDQGVQSLGAYLFGVGRLIVGHQTHSADAHVIDFPAGIGTVKAVVNRHVLPAGLDHFGAHQHLLVVGIGAERQQPYLFVVV